MAGANVEWTRRALDAFNRGDWEQTVAGAAPGFVCDFSRASGPGRGTFDVDGWVAFLTDWGSHWESMEIDVHEYLEIGDEVVVPWTLRTRGRAGIDVTATTAWVFSFREGACTRLTYYETREEAVEASRSAA